MALRLRSRPKGRPTKSARRAAPRARLARKTRHARIDCPSRPSQTDRAAGTAQRTGAEAGEAGTKRKDKTERPSESKTQGQSKTKRRPARARKAMERKAKQKGTKLEEKRRKADRAEKEKGEREGGENKKCAEKAHRWGEARDGARSRGRTGTNLSIRGILSPLCLPISPSGRYGGGGVDFNRRVNGFANRRMTLCHPAMSEPMFVEVEVGIEPAYTVLQTVA